MLDLRSESFSTVEACRLAGITFRQLDYWARTNLITPSVQESTTSGKYRRWSRSDVIVAAAVAQFGQWWVRRLVAPELYAAVDRDGWLVLDVAERQGWAVTVPDRIPELVRERGAVTIIRLRGLVDFGDGS